MIDEAHRRFAAVTASVQLHPQPGIPHSASASTHGDLLRYQVADLSNPFYGIRWALRPLRASFKGRREPLDSASTSRRLAAHDHPLHPRATKPRNRRLPLAVLALAAVLEGREEYEIVDGNVDDDPTALILDLIDDHEVELLGVSAMPGPQMVAAMETSPRDPPSAPARTHRAGAATSLPSIPTPRSTRTMSTTSSAARAKTRCSNSSTRSAASAPFDSILGLCSTRTSSAFIATNPERPMKGPDEFPWSPFHRLAGGEISAALVLRQTHRRASRQHRLPVQLQFLRSARRLWNREKLESPERTVAILSHLVDTLWRRLCPVLRHELLPARRPRARADATAWLRSISAGGARRESTSCRATPTRPWQRSSAPAAP